MAHIVVVEDDAGVRRMVTFLLTDRGHKVEAFETVSTVMERLLDGTAPDLLLSDVSLPDGSGLELAARARSKHPKLPIMLLSGLSSESDFKRGFAAGADDYIRKPFHPDELTAKVDVILARTSRSETQAVNLDLPGGCERAFGRYRVEEVMGRGSYGTVYRAHDLNRDASVALKVLNARPGIQEEERLRFLRETYALSSVEHPNVVAVHDFGVAEGRFYYAMDAVEGPTLRRHVNRAGTATPDEALAFLEVTSAALCALTAADLVHRDLTPANVILRDARWEAPILIDFGLAKRPFDQGLTQQDLVMGTPGYIAPETMRGLPHDARSDLFALGVLVRYALTGEEPFKGFVGMRLIDHMCKHELPIPQAISPAFGELLRDMNRIDPADRLQSAAAVISRISEIRSRGSSVAAAS